MVTTNSIPQFIITQATEPATHVAGSLWYDTSTGKLYSADGAAWTMVSPNTAKYEKLLQEYGIDILRLMAATSLTISDFNLMFLDIFSDSTGYSNTIDTVNTTAVFSTDKYVNQNIIPDTWTGGVQSDHTSGTGKYGNKYTILNDCILYGFTTDSYDDSTKYYIGTTGGASDIATGSITGHAVTGLTISLTTSSPTIYITFDGNGGSVNHNFINNVVVGAGGSSNLLQTKAWWTGSDANNTAIIATVSTGLTTNANKIVQTNTITVDSNLTQFNLYAANAIAGTGTVTYKVSFDNGINWSDEHALNSNITNSTAGTSIKLRILLNGVAVGNTSEASNYAFMVWY